MPFSCEVCGGWTWPDLLPAAGDVLRCPRCAHERAFVRPPLLIVAGTVGIGKTTLCARLTGTIPGVVCLDADILAELHSVVPPNKDYVAFWRSLMRLAHELAQNNVTVVYFGVMLPEQVLANSDVGGYFDSVHFLCLTCTPEVLRSRLTRREGEQVANAAIDRWLDFNRTLTASAQDTPNATLLNADRPVDDLERDARQWIVDRFGGKA